MTSFIPRNSIISYTYCMIKDDWRVKIPDIKNPRQIIAVWTHFIKNSYLFTLFFYENEVKAQFSTSPSESVQKKFSLYQVTCTLTIKIARTFNRNHTKLSLLILMIVYKNMKVNQTFINIKKTRISKNNKNGNLQDNLLIHSIFWIKQQSCYKRYSDGKRIHDWKTNPSAINGMPKNGCCHLQRGENRLPFSGSIAAVRTMQERWIRLLLHIKDAVS